MSNSNMRWGGEDGRTLEPVSSIIIPRPPLHCITGGHPTSGKSTFLTTWPKPLLVFLFDGVGKDIPYLKWGKLRGGQQYDEHVVLNSGQDTGILRKHIVTGEGEIILEYYNDISPESYSYYWFEQRIKDRGFLRDVLLPDRIGTIGIDSVSFMELSARTYWKHVINANQKNPNNDPRAASGASTDMLEFALLTSLNGVMCNYNVLAHYSDSKEDVNGMPLYTVSAPGRLEKKKLLLAGFSEQYRAYVAMDGANKYHLLQTMPDVRFQCATQVNAPNPAWQDYEQLWVNWDG